MMTPYGLATSILDHTALQMATRAELGARSEERLTPYAAKVFETQRRKSKE